MLLAAAALLALAADAGGAASLEFKIQGTPVARWTLMRSGIGVSSRNSAPMKNPFFANQVKPPVNDVW